MWILKLPYKMTQQTVFFLAQSAIVQSRQEEKYVLGSIPSFMEAAVTSQIKGAQTK